MPPDPFARFFIVIQNDFVARAVGRFEPGRLGHWTAERAEVLGDRVATQPVGKLIRGAGTRRVEVAHGGLRRLDTGVGTGYRNRTARGSAAARWDLQQTQSADRVAEGLTGVGSTPECLMPVSDVARPSPTALSPRKLLMLGVTPAPGEAMAAELVQAVDEEEDEDPAVLPALGVGGSGEGDG